MVMYLYNDSGDRITIHATSCYLGDGTHGPEGVEQYKTVHIIYKVFVYTTHCAGEAIAWDSVDLAVCHF